MNVGRYHPPPLCKITANEHTVGAPAPRRADRRVAPGARPRPSCPGRKLSPPAAGREVCRGAAATSPGLSALAAGRRAPPRREAVSRRGRAPRGLGRSLPRALSLRRAEPHTQRGRPTPPRPRARPPYLAHGGRGGRGARSRSGGGGGGGGAWEGGRRPRRRSSGEEPAGGRLCFHCAEPPTLRHHGNRRGLRTRWVPLDTQGPGPSGPPPLPEPLLFLWVLGGDKDPQGASATTSTPLSVSLTVSFVSPARREGEKGEQPRANSYFHTSRRPL